ncbi:MAG: prephenate dehydrogenase [Eubacteriales bacterium]|nr:prephenate dehydrogenase [Eubacteriales bacterium]
MQIGVVGLGLIGGSMAKAIKKYTSHSVFGCDMNEAVLSQALADGSIDGLLTDDAVSDCDMLLAALYPAAVVSYIQEHLERFSAGTTIVDLCGVKRAVMEPVGKLALPEGVTYIGGHPMAGMEKSGYANAKAELFQGASMILVPQDEKNTAFYEAEEFFLSLGFGRVKVTTAQEHDRVIAFTSQLAHVVSSAYVLSPTSLEHYGFSAGSYKDMTRVARLNETMWTELFLDNREALSEELDGIIERLSFYREVIADGDREALFAKLREGRERKEGIDSYENS